MSLFPGSSVRRPGTQKGRNFSGMAPASPISIAGQSGPAASKNSEIAGNTGIREKSGPTTHSSSFPPWKRRPGLLFQSSWGKIPVPNAGCSGRKGQPQQLLPHRPRFCKCAVCSPAHLFPLWQADFLHNCFYYSLWKGILQRSLSSPAATGRSD